MALTLEQKRLLEKIKRHRPDLIQQLKAEFYEEWRISKTDIVEATKNRARAMAGVKSTIKQNKKKRDAVETAVSAKTKTLAGL